MGRLSKVDLAYIAGFLDGDGSIILQLHKREAGKDTKRIKVVAVLYQDNKHRQAMEEIQRILGCGYIYTRNDHICELRIEGFQRVYEILKLLQPYLRFKRKQAELMLDLIPRLQQKFILQDKIVPWIKKMRKYNYTSHQRNALEDVPVTTDPQT